MGGQGERFELEHLPGLAEFARLELIGLGVREAREASPEALRFSFAGDARALLALRRAVAVYRLLEFKVPRPKALLGDEHLRRLAGAVAAVRALQPPGAFSSFRFAAAGAGSSAFRRLAAALERATGLPEQSEGDLVLRVVPGGGGWEVLLRLSPRPLSARDWRSCNLPGGLNATLAAVMNDLAGDGPYLNAMCGSGTLLVERALAGERAELAGFDLSERALECACENLEAAGVAGRVAVTRADARALPYANARFGAITCDLPWGDAVGSHAANAELYPAFLREMARVGRPDARLALLTHDVRLFRQVLADQAQWRVTAEHRVYHGGHYPRLYRLERA